jgi:hypothetical protein
LVVALAAALAVERGIVRVGSGVAELGTASGASAVDTVQVGWAEADSAVELGIVLAGSGAVEPGTVSAASVVDIVQVGLVEADSAVERGIVRVDFVVLHTARGASADVSPADQVLAALARPEQAVAGWALDSADRVAARELADSVTEALVPKISGAVGPRPQAEASSTTSLACHPTVDCTTSVRQASAVEMWVLSAPQGSEAADPVPVSAEWEWAAILASEVADPVWALAASAGRGLVSAAWVESRRCPLRLVTPRRR